MTHCADYIHKITVQTDPLTIQAHIYVLHANLLEWATSLQMSSQINQSITLAHLFSQFT